MLSSIQLRNFRSYTNSSFDFNTGLNVIVGPNGSGKTNLLEAILVLAQGRSYRVKDNELIRFKQAWATIAAKTTNGSSRRLKISVNTKPTKLYEIDGKSYQRLNLNLRLPLVLFEPNSLDLLSGGPERRRDYLDDIIVQLVPGYDKLCRQYARSLFQRNALLKQPSLRPEQLFPWNVRLSELGGQIIKARLKLIEQFNASLAPLYKELSKSKTSVSLAYIHKWSIDTYASYLLKELDTNLKLDHARGFTSTGPHREDFLALLNNKPSQDTASRGESRTIVLALKMAELELKQKTVGPPMLLLDDVFSELDKARRQSFADYLKGHQTFITATDAEGLAGFISSQAKTIKLPVK